MMLPNFNFREDFYQYKKIEAWRPGTSYCMSTNGLLWFRGFFALYNVLLFGLALPIYIIALTACGLLAHCFYTWLAFIVTWRQHRGERQNGVLLHNRDAVIHDDWAARWTVRLQELGLTLGITITFNYWLWLTPETFEFVDFMAHGLPFVLLCIDFAINNIKFCPAHIFDTVIFVTAYLILNLTVTLSSEPVYDPLTWRDTTSAAMVLAIFFAAALGFVLFYFLGELKPLTERSSESSDPQPGLNIDHMHAGVDDTGEAAEKQDSKAAEITGDDAQRNSANP